MDLSEKIQKLRKEHNLTQEQLAEKLFVSRTAVSKWENGRGMPSMESLKLMSRIFGITLDVLLSTEEIALIAENENKENISRFASYIDGVFNISATLSLLLPLYKTEIIGVFYSVPLYQLKTWLAILYWIFPSIIALCGAFQIFLCRSERKKLYRIIKVSTFILNICAILLLILSGQPYPAIMFFALLIAKGAILTKKGQ